MINPQPAQSTMFGEVDQDENTVTAQFNSDGKIVLLINQTFTSNARQRLIKAIWNAGAGLIKLPENADPASYGAADSYTALEVSINPKHAAQAFTVRDLATRYTRQYIQDMIAQPEPVQVSLF